MSFGKMLAIYLSSIVEPRGDVTGLQFFHFWVVSEAKKEQEKEIVE